MALDMVLPPKRLPFLKLTANAPENGWLEYDGFLLGQKAYFQGLWLLVLRSVSHNSLWKNMYLSIWYKHLGSNYSIAIGINVSQLGKRKIHDLQTYLGRGLSGVPRHFRHLGVGFQDSKAHNALDLRTPTPHAGDSQDTRIAPRQLMWNLNITHLQWKMIWTKLSWISVQHVNFPWVFFHFWKGIPN